MSFAVDVRKPEIAAKPVELWIESLRASFLSRIATNDESAVQFNQRTELQAKRQREFRQGRTFAKSLLRQLGCDAEVGTNDDRSPAWPEGFVGSISHSQNWMWTVVGQQSELASIGIDTEAVVSQETRQQLLFEIATDQEWEAFGNSPLTPEQIFSVVFSAKEAFYKCCYPLVKQYFGFEHAIVDRVLPTSLQIKTALTHPSFDAMPKSLEVQYFVDRKDVFTVTSMKPVQ